MSTTHALFNAAIKVCKQHAAISLALLEKALLLLWAHVHTWALPSQEGISPNNGLADQLGSHVPRCLGTAELRELCLSAKQPMALWGAANAKGGRGALKPAASLSTVLLELQEYTPELLSGGAQTSEMMRALCFKANAAFNKGLG